MVFKQRNLVEAVFAVMFVVAMTGLVVAYFVTDRGVYLVLAIVVLVIAWPLERVVKKVARRSDRA